MLRSADGYKVFVAEPVGDHYEARARTVLLGPVSGDEVVIPQVWKAGSFSSQLGINSWTMGV